MLPAHISTMLLNALVADFNSKSPSARTIASSSFPIFEVHLYLTDKGEYTATTDINLTYASYTLLGSAKYTWGGQRDAAATADADSFFQLSTNIPLRLHGTGDMHFTSRPVQKDIYTFFVQSGNTDYSWPTVNPTGHAGQYVYRYVAGVIDVNSSITTVEPSEMLFGVMALGTATSSTIQFIQNGVVEFEVFRDIPTTSINFRIETAEYVWDESHTGVTSQRVRGVWLNYNTNEDGSQTPSVLISSTTNGRSLELPTKNVKYGWQVSRVTGAEPGSVLDAIANRVDVPPFPLAVVPEPVVGALDPFKHFNVLNLDDEIVRYPTFTAPSKVALVTKNGGWEANWERQANDIDGNYSTYDGPRLNLGLYPAGTNYVPEITDVNSISVHYDRQAVENGLAGINGGTPMGVTVSTSDGVVTEGLQQIYRTALQVSAGNTVERRIRAFPGIHGIRKHGNSGQIKALHFGDSVSFEMWFTDIDNPLLAQWTESSDA